MNSQFEPHKSSLGFDANLIMIIAYFGAIVVSFIPGINILAWAVPLVIFFIERDSSYVKYHAIQSLLLEVLGLVFTMTIGIIIAILVSAVIFSGSGAVFGLAGLVTLLSIAFPIIMLIFSIICAIKSWNYECYKIPLIGNWAEKLTLK